MYKIKLSVVYLVALLENLTHDEALGLGQRAGRLQNNQITDSSLTIVILARVTNSPLDALRVPRGEMTGERRESGRAARGLRLAWQCASERLHVQRMD